MPDCQKLGRGYKKKIGWIKSREQKEQLRMARVSGLVISASVVNIKMPLAYSSLVHLDMHIPPSCVLGSDEIPFLALRTFVAQAVGWT